MTKNDKKQLTYIDQCIAGHISVVTLCGKLNVTPAGLGHRIIKLQRNKYNEDHEDWLHEARLQTSNH